MTNWHLQPLLNIVFILFQFSIKWIYKKKKDKPLVDLCEILVFYSAKLKTFISRWRYSTNTTKNFNECSAMNNTLLFKCLIMANNGIKSMQNKYNFSCILKIKKKMKKNDSNSLMDYNILVNYYVAWLHD
jgi:hypothetical protein